MNTRKRAWTTTEGPADFAHELKACLHVEVKAPLLRLVNDERVVREKVAGLYLYCSPDAAVRTHQLASRRARDGAGQAAPEGDTVLTDDVKAAIILFFSVLKQLNFSLRVNHQKRAHGSSPGTRDPQFRYIRGRRTTFAGQGDPIISVDAKKRELVGHFKNDGTAWSQAPRVVNDHDFRSLATGVAIPYAISNTEANRGFVCVGTSRGTPEFAMERHPGLSRGA